LRYIDSGTRNPADALGTWLQNELTPDVVELRWQSGYFGVDGLPPFIGTLQRLAAADLPVHVLIGSNEGDTLQSDVAQLVTLLGLPRPGAQLGIVSYSGAFYHPKTYHLRRDDGSQAAYVGSANLTLAGVSSLHIEAGVLLDTLQGDSTAVLSAIADNIDDWFNGGRAGIEIVADTNDIPRLVASGVLSAAPQRRAPALVGVGSAGTGPGRPRLQPLIRFPAHPAVPQSPPFPPYALFAPGATAPTVGAAALSGATLRGGNVGLVVRLNRDSARHWLDRRPGFGERGRGRSRGPRRR